MGTVGWQFELWFSLALCFGPPSKNFHNFSLHNLLSDIVVAQCLLMINYACLVLVYVNLVVS